MKKLMAANWKMHKIRYDAEDTLKKLFAGIADLPDDREVLFFVPFTALASSAATLDGRAGFFLGGQNMYPADHGAFTGEISPAMLKDCGCTYVLTGHSERRALFKESSEFIGQKNRYALEQGLKVVFCIGETLEQREQGGLEAVLGGQMEKGFAGISSAVPENLAVAYEPVWAIGTGKVAGAAEILESHTFVRDWLRKRYPATGDGLRILYGGSVKPENCKEIIGLDNVDGVLVGGASLDAEMFRRIILA